MVLIGGLVPETLIDSEEPHQGTLDVDVLLPLALQYDRDEEDFSWLESALRDAGFVPNRENTGWRWVVDVDGLPVVVEFLVDVPDAQGQEIWLPGTRDLSAMNLAGPGPALRDARVIQLGVRDAKVAGLGGYLTAKAAAIVGRGKQKDLYDFAYVLVNSGRRAEELAAAVVAATMPDPAVYSAEAVAAGSEETRQDLAADAVAAVSAFAAALKVMTRTR
jgi:hypothetical protein